MQGNSLDDSFLEGEKAMVFFCLFVSNYQLECSFYKCEVPLKWFQEGICSLGNANHTEYKTKKHWNTWEPRCKSIHLYLGDPYV